MQSEGGAVLGEREEARPAWKKVRLQRRGVNMELVVFKMKSIYV
jgi:hypothetical protein